MKFLKIIIKIFYQLYLSSLSLSFQVLFLMFLGFGLFGLSRILIFLS